MIRAWLKARRDFKDRLRFREGWDWAAGDLLRGKHPTKVEAWSDYGICFDGPNQWDKGIAAACAEWRDLHNIKG